MSNHVRSKTLPREVFVLEDGLISTNLIISKFTEAFCSSVLLDLLKGISAGDRIEGEITVVRKKENHRLMEVRMEHKVTGRSILAQKSPQRTDFFHIE